MRTTVKILGFMALLLALALPAMAADYDLVILNGRVMDPETMRNEIANAGIKVVGYGHLPGKRALKRMADGGCLFDHAALARVLVAICTLHLPSWR